MISRRPFLLPTVLALAAFVVPAVRAEPPPAAPKPSDTDAHLLGTVKARASKATAQGPAESNEKVTGQPRRIEDSYPLANDADREKSAKLLQQIVVDLLALFADYKQAHWNLNGPLYLSLHEYYQDQADKYRMYADVFAERILHLDYSVDGRHGTVARTTVIPDPPAGYQTDNESIKLLIDRVTVFQKEVYQGIKTTEDTDAPTSNKLQDLAYEVDKNLWQLRIHLQKPGGPGEDLPWKNQQARDRAGNGE